MSDSRTPKYHVADLIEVLGCSRTLYNSWIQRGLLKPSVPAKGSGRPSLWSFDAILEAKMVKIMGDAGISLKNAGKWAQLAIMILGTDQQVIDLGTEKPYMSIEDCPGAVFLVIDINKIREQVQAILD